MKYLITESQHRRLFEEEEKVLHFPSLKYFNDDWNTLQKYMEQKGNPPYIIDGNLDLSLTSILYTKYTETDKSLGNLISVGGSLVLWGTSIKSLGNLTSVGGSLILQDTRIESFGNLTSVGGYLDLEDTPLSEKYTREEIRQMVNVGGGIWL